MTQKVKALQSGLPYRVLYAKWFEEARPARIVLANDPEKGVPDHCAVRFQIQLRANQEDFIVANPLFDSLFGCHAGRETPFLYLMDVKI